MHTNMEHLAENFLKKFKFYYGFHKLVFMITFLLFYLQPNNFTH